MISPLLVLALFFAAPADPNPVRKAYAGCLQSFMEAGLNKKMTAQAFDEAVTTACADKESMFRMATVAFDVAHGVSRASSEQGVADEVTDIFANVRDRYRLFANMSGPPPTVQPAASATP